MATKQGSARPTPQPDPFGDFEATASKASLRKSYCGVGRLLQDLESDSAIHELGGELAPVLRRALANKDLTANGILAALKTKLDVSWNLPSTPTLQRHRKGQCYCERNESK